MNCWTGERRDEESQLKQEANPSPNDILSSIDGVWMSSVNRGKVDAKTFVMNLEFKIEASV